MTKLDLVLARIRKLSPERQERLAVEIAYRLEAETGDSVFTEAEWDAIEASMDPSGDDIPHEQIVAEMQSRFPG